MSTLICISMMVEDVESALRDAAASRDAGADLVEYRLDQFFSGEGGDSSEWEVRQILDLVARSPLPCIITCRPTHEGGQYDGDESSRIALFERLGTAFGEGERPPRYIDVELSTIARSANIRQKVKLAIQHPEQLRDVQTSLILSMHDFGGRPADLSRRLLQLQREAEATGARVVKVAYRARSIRDNLELFDLLRHQERPMIALGMGEFGLMSRVLAPKFGGFISFAGLRSLSTTAPGQPAIADLLHLYRFRSIGPRTRTYGVIGYPLAHSLSPHVHNAGFEAIGHDGVYLPLPVVGGGDGGVDGSDVSYASLKATLCELLDYAPLDFSGASITHPHKQNLVRLARELNWQLDDISAATGSANTIILDRDAGSPALRVGILNTDAPALLSALRDAIGDPAGHRVAIIGAGGLGRAAAFILAESGADVTVASRSADRARGLIESLRDAGAPAMHGCEVTELRDLDPEIFINCTPLGMAGGPDPGASPISRDTLSKAASGAIVMDTVYNPNLTPLLRAATDAGLRTIDGATMFVRQAALQFTAWTGKPAPSTLFERIVREQPSL